MKTTAFLICYSGMLISLDVLASEGEKDPPPRFPLFMLPSFSLPSLPYLQKLALLHRQTPPEKVVATKTEYMEVTRRQTVHPICYTAYEARAPCLSYAQSAFQYDDYDTFEFDSVHETQENFDLNAIRNSIKVSPTFQITPTPTPNGRNGKYLEWNVRRNYEEPLETATKIQDSGFFTSALALPPQPTEYLTKTVLITKLEKYTDRRVTATLLALNCLPNDRSIPLCQAPHNPIKEAPDRRVDTQFATDPPLASATEKSEELNSEEPKDGAEVYGYPMTQPVRRSAQA